MSEPMQHATWKVTAQSPRTMVGAAGQLEDGYTVIFLTGGGHTGTVFVPDTQYTPDNVRTVVQARADLLDAVGGLTSD